MYTGIYQMAGLTISISSVYPAIHRQCRGYEGSGTPDLEVVMTPEDIAQERSRGDENGCFEDGYLESLAVYRNLADQVLHREIMLFHGSAVSVDGKAYLFTAKSGTGKSTHTRLWRQMLGERAVMVNDDKPLIRLGGEQALICGTPWDGKHHISSNICLPLQAICILERGQENEIHEITAQEALPMLLQQSYRPSAQADFPQYLHLIDLLTRKVRFYRLHCNMDPEAARVSFTALHENG